MYVEVESAGHGVVLLLLDSCQILSKVGDLIMLPQAVFDILVIPHPRGSFILLNSKAYQLCGNELFVFVFVSNLYYPDNY